MTTEESSAAKTRGGTRRRSLCLPSCFRPSPAAPGSTPEATTAEMMTTTKSKRRWRRILGGKQKTVPVNAAVAAAAPLGREEPKPGKKRSFLHWWFRKNHQGKRIKGPISTNHTEASQVVNQVMCKSKARAEPAPLYRIQDQARTVTRTIHPDSAELSSSQHVTSSQTYEALLPAQKRKPGVREFDSLVGLSVIVVVLMLLLICGRMGAAVFVCTWMYLLPHIRTASKSDNKSTIRKEDEEVDLNSTEYKKMIVLKGLLERDRRRPSAVVFNGAH